MGWILGLGNGIVFRQGGSQNWSSYCTQLTAQATSDTEYTLVATASGTYDLLHIEYSDDMGATWTEAGTTATDTYNATGMTAGTLYMWRARLSKGTNYSVYTEAINYLRSVDEPSFTTTGGTAVYSEVDDKLTFAGVTDSPFWFSFWGKAGDAGVVDSVVRNNEYNIRFFSTIRFRVYSEAGSTVYIGRQTASATLTAVNGSWHHFIFYYDGSGASSGCKIYVDKVQKDTSDYAAGTYVKMITNVQSVTFGLGTNGEMSDIKAGASTLTEQNMIDLYDNKYIGSELVHYPCTEGYGMVIHNVLSNDIEKHLAIGAGNLAPWANTQAIWKYNYYHGGTKVGDYFFPNLYNSQVSFRQVDTVLLAGQSNAEGAGVLAQLAGTDYADMVTENFLPNTYYRSAGIWRKFSKAEAYNGIGVDDLFAFRYSKAGVEMLAVKYGPGSTNLCAGAGNDWNASSTGECLDTFIGYITDMLAKAFYRGCEPWIKTLIWIQGEGDYGAGGACAAAYYDNFVALMTKLETIVPGGFNVQMVQLRHASDVKTAQALYVTNNPTRSHLITTDDATTNDGTHYDSAYLINMTERMRTNIAGISYSAGLSYLPKIIPGYSKLYYTAHP